MPGLPGLAIVLVVVDVESETLTGVVRRRSSESGAAARRADAGTVAPEQLPGAPLGGRYTLLVRLGAGGMGVVYEAHDRELDRRVAIKLLHPGTARTHARRLLREAQTLAKLSHPNLVPVFDVGRSGEELFVAMELVRGQSLDRAALGASWRDTLRLVIEAGRGLEHAHRSGVVHRDFKPSNVLVGEDGRARVADFGLARPLRLSTAEIAPRAEAERGTSDDASELTRPGRVAGTPAYMPPELLHGASFDERSDQFSFCLSAWEVLHGGRPRRDPQTGGVLPMDGDLQLPRHIRAALRKGMALEPAARHGSMRELLDALSRTRGRGWTVPALVTGAAVTAAIVVLALGRGPCDGTADELATAWGEPQSSAIRARMVALGLPDAAGLHAAVAQQLDAYTGEWSRLRHDACVANAVEHRESDASFDRRMRCLEERGMAMRAVVDLLAQSERREVVLAGPAAVDALPQLAPCGDAELLSALVWQPEPGQQPLARRLQGELARVQALAQTGQISAALPDAEALVRETETLVASPVHAKALLLLAGLRRSDADPERAHAGFRAAAEAAGAAHDDETLTDAWLELVSLLAADARREQEFETAASLVEGLLARLGGSTAMRVRLLDSRARMAASAGRFEEAAQQSIAAIGLLVDGDEHEGLLAAQLEAAAGLHLQRAGRLRDAVPYLERAIAITSRVLTPSHPRVAMALVNLSLVQPPADSEASLVRATEILRATFPDGHPDLASALGNLGLRLLDRGAYDEAEAALREALAIQRRAFPDGHPQLANVLVLLADTLNEVGRRDEALAAAEEALAMRRALLPTDHADIGRALRMIGAIHYDAARVDIARGYYEQALAVFDRSLPADHPLVAGALSGIGECAIVRHDAARALEVCTRGLEIERAARGDDAPDIVPFLSCIAAAHSERREYELAIPLLERAITLWTEHDMGPLLPAQMRLQLATALDAAGRDRPRVVALAESVLAAVASEPGARDRLVEPAQRLLDAAPQR